MRHRAENPADHKECGPYLLGRLRGGRRLRSAIIDRSGALLDFDAATEETWERAADLDVLGIVHTTFSSRPGALRLRAIVPFDRPATTEEYSRVVGALAARIGSDGLDPGSYQPERFMYRPAVSDEHREWYRYKILDGPEASVDELLAECPEVPAAARAVTEGTKRDPLTLPGVAGAFNRAYSIPETIETFLADVYEPVGDGLWRPVGSTHPPGVREVSPGVIYSHHASDPAYQKALGAFDLVRVHRYGYQDEELAAPGTSLSKLPSTLSLTEDVEMDPRVADELRGAERAEIEAAFEDLGEEEYKPSSSWSGASSAEMSSIVDAYLDGTLERIRPEVGFLGGRDDEEESMALFYRGRTNGVAGDSNAGKTWTGIEAAKQEIEAGRTVVYVDFEDDLRGIVSRFLDIDTDPEAVRTRLAYVQPDTRFDDRVSRLAFKQVLDRRHPSLVVIDSTGEALSMEGAKPNEDDEVARWFQLLPRYASRHQSNPAVVVLDHVTKADGGLWPIGSQRKRAAISGAQYMQDVEEPFSRTKNGAARIRCAKDRHGNYHIGQIVGSLGVTNGGGQTRLSLVWVEPEVASDSAEWRPTEAMETVSRYLAQHAEAPELRTQNRVVANVVGKKQTLTKALALLQQDGFVEISNGPNRSMIYSLLRPYPDDFGEVEEA